MKLTVHVLKDAHAGFEQKRYIEHNLCIEKKTGVRNFMDRINILSTYIPLFLPIRNECISKLTDPEK
jgi:hypothetical protein